MAHHDPCPVWAGYVLASPLRKLLVNPRTLLSPYLGSGMTVLEPGPAMGFFTLEIARLVGESGRVIAVDIQPGMLERLRLRALRAGVAARIDTRLADQAGMHITDASGKVDFALAFACVHEMPSANTFFIEAFSALKKSGRVLFAEPSQVTEEEFRTEVLEARRAGFQVDRPLSIRGNRAVLLLK